MIRSGVAATIKALKPMAAAAATVATTSEVASVTVEEPVVAPVEETIQEAPVEEAVQEAPVEEAVQEAPVEEAVYEESLEETPVEEPVVAPAPAPVQQKPIQQQRPVQQQRPAQRPVQKQAAPVKKAQKKSPPPKKKKKKVPVAAIILPIIALLLVAALIIVPIVLLIVGGIVLGVGGLIVWGIISLVGGTETYDIYEIKNVSGGYAIVDIIDDSYQSTVEIPDYINGKPVVEIREHAFSNANIDYVILPETMKMVKTFAFEGSDIIGVGISGATTIQSNAFNYCSSLNYVAFSGENATIEYDAFYHCYNILAFEISAESITVEYDAVPSNSSPVMLAGPAHVCDGEKISLDNTTDLYITSGAIEEVVDGDSVRRLIIGSGVERIDSYAFDDCNYVTSVTFEDTYGWVAESPYDGTESFYSSDLSNASTNADLLLDQYNSFYWYNN